MKRLLLIVLPFVAVACSVFAPKPDRTRSYLLVEVTPPAQSVSSDVSIAIGPVELPTYLDRAEIVTRVLPNQIVLSVLDRWAEPLQENFTRVFSTELARAVGTDQIVRFPWFGEQKVDYRVVVDVEQFEARSDGVAGLTARWKVLRSTDGEVVRQARSSHEVPVDDSTAASAVEALSRATAQLAQEIADAIPSSRTPR